MTNHDDKFQQRWEFRRGDVDGDTSSDDSRSNSNGDKKHKPVTDLVLLDNDESVDTQQGQRPDNLDTYNSVKSQTVEAAGKKIESRKKKNVVKKKKLDGCSVKENKRKRNLDTTETVMLKDLKMFAGSLIHELTVDRENMFANMREEMGKLVASGLKLKPVKKNVRRSQKNKVHPKKGTEVGVKPQNCNNQPMDRKVVSNVTSDACKISKALAEVVKNDQVLELTTANKLHKEDRLRLPTVPHHTNLANGSDQVVSSSYLTLPTVLPKPQLQNQRNRVPSEVPMSNSGSEIGKLMEEKRIYHRPAEFQPEERFGSFSNSYRRSMALIGQNCAQTTSLAVGFPVPLNQGTDNGPNMSSLTYRENSFMDNNRLGPRMNGSIARFPGVIPASSERVFPNSIITFAHHKPDGEFASLRPQELKDGQFHRTSLRKEH